FPLKENSSKSFIGSYVLGMGFVLTTEQAEALIAKDPRNKEVLFPYLNGEDLNNDPEQRPSRWVINFFDWPEDKARTYSDCFEVIEHLVKPERLTKNDKTGREKWWQFLRPRKELYQTISKLDHVMVVARISKTLAMTFVDREMVFADALVVFNNQSFSIFCLMQSTIHNIWAWKYCTTMKSDLNYTPGNVFETFPFPEINTSELEHLGTDYFNLRKNIMRSTKIGLTKIYNYFHDIGLKTLSDHTLSQIEELRSLHVKMDLAVLKSYGWEDIDMQHGFYELEYLPENDRIRFTIQSAARKEILKRLLKLNNQLYNAEQSENLVPKGNIKRNIKNSTDIYTAKLF
ncbi:hypothetical protein LT679_18560, partial [Mucilaginibacter roseus]